MECGLKTRAKPKLPKIAPEGVVSETAKNEFLLELFPLLIVKDREIERMQFKQVKRILVANSKMFGFLKKMNDILNKAEDPTKIGFIKSVVAQYRQY